MSANFDPSMGNYKDMKPFRYWCQKVLPLVYDDSLSYSELLSKVVKYLNDTMANVEVLHDDVDALHTAYQQLENYVNTYFANLDVQEEINNKLDAMAQSGALSELIAPFVAELLPTEVEQRITLVVANQLPAVVRVQLPSEVMSQLPSEVALQIPDLVTAWLNLHVVQPVEVIIDDSLTIQGAAADAKATGDAISELKSALSVQVYLEQSSTSKQVRSKPIGLDYAKELFAKCWLDSYVYRIALAKCNNADYSDISVVLGHTSDRESFLSALSGVSNSKYLVVLIQKYTSGSNLDISPSDVYFGTMWETIPKAIKGVEFNYTKLYQYSDTRLASEPIEGKDKLIKSYLSDPINYDIYVGGSNTIDDNYTMVVKWGTTHDSYIYTISNTNYNYYVCYIAKRSDRTLPIGVGDVLLTDYRATELQSAVSTLQYRIDKVDNNPYSGKTFAVFCDSIGTHGNSGHWHNVNELTVTADDVGHELSAYVTYYDLHSPINHDTGLGPFVGLTIGGIELDDDDIGTEITFTPTTDDIGKSLGNVFDWNGNSLNVWWCTFAKHFGMEPIPVCWASSSYSTHEESTLRLKTAYAWHPSQIRKAGIRTVGSMTRKAPDYVILARGCNDMTHSPYDRLTADFFNALDWDFPADDTAGSYKGLKEAIAKTIQGVWTAYPLAKIILCTIPYVRRIDHDNFPTNNNDTNYCQWNDAIRECADFFGCELFDFAKDGVTHANLSTYSGDNTHPNQLGHDMMAKRAIADFKG